jgi:hypothetical protein
MSRILTIRLPVLAAAVVLPFTSLAAQYSSTWSRIELTPFGSYHWGGSIGTDAFSTIPAGTIQEEASFSWGAILSFAASPNSAVEIIYIRQDTDVKFKQALGQTRNLGGFANNYIQFGGRADFQTGGRMVPFFSASIGMNILDPKAGDLGSTTRWAWSLGGGARYKPEGKNWGLRLDARWLVTPVPSGTYGGWCDFWGCYAVEGTSWLGQGQVGAGIIIGR